MKLKSVCALMGLAVTVVVAWNLLDGRTSSTGVSTRAGNDIMANDFTPIPMPDGMSDQGIIIFAPQNCPSDAAQRAEVMAQYLSGKGIAFTRSTSAEYGDLASREEVDQVMAVMNGPIPVVYVNGKAKANPKPEEVEAQYRLEGRG
ncbi:MAG TPA: hypothetical protein VGC74_01150 [Stenotrophomonas sp.]|jgi:hypothetical protein